MSDAYGNRCEEWKRKKIRSDEKIERKDLNIFFICSIWIDILSNQFMQIFWNADSLFTFSATFDSWINLVSQTTFIFVYLVFPGYYSICCNCSSRTKSQSSSTYTRDLFISNVNILFSCWYKIFLSSYSDWQEKHSLKDFRWVLWRFHPRHACVSFQISLKFSVWIS